MNISAVDTKERSSYPDFNYGDEIEAMLLCQEKQDGNGLYHRYRCKNDK
jgi:hypothetical protein